MARTARLAARLADLSHAQLVEIAVAGCEASTQVKNRADAILAAHKPLAQWAVEGVLLSSDLLPHLLAPLQLEDGAAAAVCWRWAEGWKATSEGRRRLTGPVALNFPQHLLHERSLEMAVVPGGDEQLVVGSGSTVHFLGRDMSSRTSFELPYTCYGVAASEQFVYLDVDNVEVQCLTHDGTKVAIWHEMNRYNAFPTLAPGGPLFCVLYGDEEQGDEIVALDAQTLQPRHRFGLSLLKDACAMVVVGEELFVCDRSNGRLQVFSLAGEHRRSITGEWKRPEGLCFVKDRLYLVEQVDNASVDEWGELMNPLQGRRIFVLSLQGDTLQVCTHPDEGQSVKNPLCYFEGKLLVPVRYRPSPSETADDPEVEEMCIAVTALAGA